MGVLMGMTFADWFFACCIVVLSIAVLWRFTLAMWPEQKHPFFDRDD